MRRIVAVACVGPPVRIGRGYCRGTTSTRRNGGGNTPLMSEQRIDFDLQSYVHRVLTGPCFICGIVGGEDGASAHVVYRDDHHIAFLPRYHVLLGYALVAPTDHREAVVNDFSINEYLALQQVVHRVARAVTATVATERVYILSLGSQQGNAHVHWHVAALPPGVRYSEQQCRALMTETKGVLALTAEEQSALADRLRAAIEATL